MVKNEKNVYKNQQFWPSLLCPANVNMCTAALAQLVCPTAAKSGSILVTVSKCSKQSVVLSANKKCRPNQNILCIRSTVEKCEIAGSVLFFRPISCWPMNSALSDSSN